MLKGIKSFRCYYFNVGIRRIRRGCRTNGLQTVFYTSIIFDEMMIDDDFPSELTIPKPSNYLTSGRVTFVGRIVPVLAISQHDGVIAFSGGSEKS